MYLRPFKRPFIFVLMICEDLNLKPRKKNKRKKNSTENNLHFLLFSHLRKYQKRKKKKKNTPAEENWVQNESMRCRREVQIKFNEKDHKAS